jgi:hypothetical protein
VTFIDGVSASNVCGEGEFGILFLVVLFIPGRKYPSGLSN